MGFNINLPPVNPGVTSPGSISTSNGSSWSASTPSAIQTPQSELEQQIAQAASQLGAYQYQWGLNQYANTSAMTNASVDNYLTASQQDMNLANQTMQQYQQTTVPEINQQAQMAAQYTSPSRIGINMGAAESQSEQGTNAALQAAKQNLQSYGINPNSGEYQELTMANKTAGGAAAAGAGQQAELATEATGRQLLAQSIATGQQLPGQAINASNAGIQGIAGAENATLANANTGVALTTSANPYEQTAMSLKYPSIGNTSSSGSQNTSNATSIPEPPAPNNGSMVGAGSNYLTQLSNYSGQAGGFVARGGAIPGGFSFASGGDATQGGYVPQNASPSGGVNVDDVPANLNAEEFVIPRDVARWKGEEFWHKEIAKSRAARAKAAATVGPTAGPPQAPGQQPTFTSQSFRGGSQQRFAAGGTTATNTMGSWGSAGSYGNAAVNGAGNVTGTPTATPTTSAPAPTTSPTTTPTSSGYGPTFNVPGGIGGGGGAAPIDYATDPMYNSLGGGNYDFSKAGYAAGKQMQQQTDQGLVNAFGQTKANNILAGNYGTVALNTTNPNQSESAMRRGGSIRRMYGGGGI